MAKIYLIRVKKKFKNFKDLNNFLHNVNKVI